MPGSVVSGTPGKFNGTTLVNLTNTSTNSKVSRGNTLHDPGDAWEGDSPSDTEHTKHKTSDSQAENEDLCCVSAEYQDFPVEAMPGITRRFVEESAAALGCDPAYIAPHVLAVLGGLLGNKRRLLIKRSWQEPPVVWAA